MDILINNIDLSTYGISVLDYTGAFSFPSIRQDELTWNDKSGVDVNLENVRYDPKEFYLSCIVKADNEAEAYGKVNDMIEDMFSSIVFVLSLRDTARNIRECFLCKRSSVITPSISIRQQNSLYVFKLGLQDVNPNAVKYNTSIVGNAVTITYSKGETAVLYWGDGSRAEVSNSGDYTKSDYTAETGLIDVIVDIDATLEEVTPLTADFSADVVSGVKPQTVVFTDASTGGPDTYSWDFGDGSTSDEQSPTHIYNTAGTFTVTLRVYNAVQGSATEQKVDYITVRNARMLVNDLGDRALVNDAGDLGLIN